MEIEAKFTMKKSKYILTKYETIRRVERVEYEVEIPEMIKDKTMYADKQVLENNYTDCRVADILDGEILDEEIKSLRKIRQEIIPAL